jgi:hypothetical protein
VFLAALSGACSRMDPAVAVSFARNVAELCRE